MACVNLPGKAGDATHAHGGAAHCGDTSQLPNPTNQAASRPVSQAVGQPGVCTRLSHHSTQSLAFAQGQPKALASITARSKRLVFAHGLLRRGMAEAWQKMAGCLGRKLQRII